MNWLRLWHVARTDRKLEALTDAQYRVFVNLLIFASEQPERGLIQGKSEALLAVEVARADVELLHATLKRLDELEIVGWDEDGVRFLHWDARQPTSDNAAERQRASRASRSDHVNVAPTSRDGHVTSPNNVVLDTDTDTEGETETETDSPSEPIHTARAGQAIEAVRAFAVPKPGRAPGSPHLLLQGALATALHCAEPETPSEKRKWSAPIAEMVRADVTPAEVPRLVAAFGELNSVPCTPQGIVNQLNRLRSDEPPPARNGKHESTRSQLDRVFGSLP